METLVTKKVSIVLRFMMNETESKERIRTQARELFMKYGIRSVSMDDIAGSLGMSKKTLYHFYADKEELVEAVIVHQINHNQDCCQADIGKAENAVHELFLSMDMVAQMFSTMNPSVLYDLEKYHPHAFQFFLRHKNDFVYSTVRNNLIRGIKEGVYRDDLNVDIISRFRVEIVMLPFNPDFQAKVKHNLAEIEEEIILHYLFGLVNMKGHKAILKYKQERTNKPPNHAHHQ